MPVDDGGSRQPTDNNSSPHRETGGIKTLLGDPKKAVIKLAVPTIVAMSVTTIYNLVDAIWVSGLGADALSALGFFFPFLFMSMALATGLGVGGGSAICRAIGAKDKAGADNIAVHTIVIMLLLAVVFTIPLFIFTEDIFVLIGAGRTVALATSYGRIMFAGTVVIFFTNVANAILRGEGDARRAMLAMVTGAGINIVLDPIFIYTLGMGVSGAASASVLSMGVSSLLLSYWLFFKKDTYVSFDFRNFRFDVKILKDIFSVGLPASVQQLSMSFMMLVMNLIIVKVGGTDGVAVFSTGWRVTTIAILPLLGIATSVVAVTGAAFGAGAFRKLNITYSYALKLGIAIEVCMAIATFILAPQITAIFTQAEGSARIADDLVTFLRVICVFYPTVAFGILSSSVFQGTGRGMNALVVTILRTLVLTLPLSWIFAFILDLGLPGIWCGMVVGNIIGTLTAFVWVKIFIRNLLKGEGSENL